MVDQIFVRPTRRRWFARCVLMLAPLAALPPACGPVVLTPPDRVASAAAAVSPLGTAESFAVLGSTTVTTAGTTTILGDLGVSPGTAITGTFVVLGGTTHPGDTTAATAQTDAATAYTTLAGEQCGTNLTGDDLGTLMPLTPGVYCFDSSAALTGTLVLDAGGNPDAQFVFQIGTTLTTATGASVTLINGGQACNVFWLVGTSATLGTGTSFVGSILARTSVTLVTGATVLGRAVAQTGAVTMDTNQVTAAHCTASKTFDFNTCADISDPAVPGRSSSTAGAPAPPPVPADSSTALPISRRAAGSTPRPATSSAHPERPRGRRGP